LGRPRRRAIGDGVSLGTKRRASMSTVSMASTRNESRAYKATLWGGLIAGILDITYAFVASALRSGRGPVWVLQSVASGLLGANTFEGGAGTAVLGAALHFLIAFTAAATYYVLSRQFKFLVRQAVIWGLIYGIVVYVVMNYVVLPLSAFPFKGGSPPLAVLVRNLVGHMLLVGLPISLAVRRYSR
ncbi:MAG TPA: hypothetical protein VEV81_08925, partial [Pyrinomonadaceae bacterium]|nr:hypothetical protein [Pyrinomonadaceae bacterium]